MTSTQKRDSLYVFDYQPLDEFRNEIRLLTVQKVDYGLKAEDCVLDHTSSDGTAVVCCRIDHASLSQPPPYKGLSYCWGDRSNSCTIHLNGAEVQVTKNLKAALRELGGKESVCLWVDALCINQYDLDERSRQVLRMAEIYKKASETICWLGIEAADSSLAFDLIQILSKVNNDSTSAQYEEALMRLYRPSETHRYDAHWTAILLLFRRPYWKRVWITQEIVSSGQVWIRCGRRCAIWEDVVRAVTSVPTAGGRSQISVVTQRLSTNLASIRNVVTIDALRGFTQEAKSRSEYVSLLNAMNRSNTALATISSDKVYALLAITKDGQDLIPRPDYELSADELCIKTTSAIIAASADLDIICYAKASSRKTLPSWVPEWTGLLNPMSMARENAGREYLYNATGSSRGGNYLRMSHTGEFLDKGLVLKVRGFVLDVVNGLGAVELAAVEPETVDLEDESRINVERQEYFGLLQPEQEQNKSQYSSEHGIFRALWVSLVLGDRDEYTAGSEFLNSLYVVQASNNKAVANNVDVFIQPWYSINKTFEIHGRALSHWFRIFTADPTRSERDMTDLTHEELTFLEEISLATTHKRLMFTHEGYLGMAPYRSRTGDKICLLLGCRIPVILRERSEGGHELVGEVYVHGIMKGEALTDANFKRLEDFCIH